MSNRIHFLSDSFLQLFFGAGGNGAMDILSHPIPLLFDDSREVLLDISNRSAPLNALYQTGSGLADYKR